jgi:hypothetical protein
LICKLFADADSSWTENKNLKYLDADLMPFSCEQFVPEGKPDFGLFLDSCIDRWGHVLMQHRGRIRVMGAMNPINRMGKSEECQRNLLFGQQ